MLINPTLGVIRGTKKFQSLIKNEKCSTQDFIIITCYFSFVVMMTLINSRRLMIRNRKAIKSDKQIDLKFKSLSKLMFGVFMVGLIGSYLSAGMTTLFSLLLIFSGLSPFVASPTSLIMACMTSASSTFMYMLDN
jgi:uncharacterized membrane protein YfcA